MVDGSTSQEGSTESEHHLWKSRKLLDEGDGMTQITGWISVALNMEGHPRQRECTSAKA